MKKPTLRRTKTSRSSRASSRSASARHVHRLHRPARPAPPRLRGRRQLGRRGAGRPLHAASRSRSTPTTRSRSSTTAAASPSASCRSTSKPAAEVVLTMLHAGGKFGGDGYKVSGGLHGVGVSVVNALSEWLELDIFATATTGTSASSAACRSAPLEKLEKLDKGGATGTTVSFMPDPEIFEEIEFDYRVLSQRLRETAFLTKNLRIELIDERAEGETVVYQYAGGIARLRRLHQPRQRRHPPQHHLLRERDATTAQVEVAMQWNSSYNESIFTFANNINTTEGGTHLSGFRGALTRTINDYARQKDLLKEKEENLSGEDMREGLTASSRSSSRTRSSRARPRPSSATPRSARLVETTVNAKLAEFLEENPSRGAADRRQDGQRGAGAQRGAQGARPHAPQGPAGGPHAARQAGRLLHPRPAPLRALPGGGRLGRRLGQAGARPQLPGHPAAARQDHQRRKGAHRQDAGQQGDPHHGQRHRRRHRRRVRPRSGPLPQDHHHDRRRRRRLAHPHPHPHVLLPPHEAAHRGRLRVHRAAAAVPPQAGQPGAVHPQGGAARGHPAARPAGADQCRQHRHRLQLQRDQYQRFLKQFAEYEGWVKKLKSQWGGELIDWLKNGPIIEANISAFDDLVRALREDIDKRYVIDVLAADPETQVADTRLVERRTGLAANLAIPFAAIAGREFQASGACTPGCTRWSASRPSCCTWASARPRPRATRTCVCRSSSSPKRASSCSASRASAR